MSAVSDTTERILRAAGELFAERGYSGTTTRAIAERAGVNEVTLFRRFENKAGILRAMGERFAESAAGFTAGRQPDSDDTHATLLALAHAEISSAVENGGAAIRLAFDSRTVPEVAELLGDGPKRNMEALAAYMAIRRDAGDLRSDIEPHVLAEAFFALTSSYVMYRMVMGNAQVPGDTALDTTVEQLVDVFWSGAARRGDRR
jgi:AcrR family transcriptional regulator